MRALSSRERGGNAAVDGQHTASRAGGAIGEQERASLGDVIRADVLLEQRARSVEALQVVGVHAVGMSARLAQVVGP